MTITATKPLRARAAAAALAIGAAVAGAAAIPASAAAHHTATPAAPSVAGVNTVSVTDALLRSEPNTYSTKLDVSQPGDIVTLYCWVEVSGGDYIWFRTHPWHSQFTGWMRADTISWGTYPSPGPC